MTGDHMELLNINVPESEFLFINLLIFAISKYKKMVSF